VHAVVQDELYQAVHLDGVRTVVDTGERIAVHLPYRARQFHRVVERRVQLGEDAAVAEAREDGPGDRVRCEVRAQLQQPQGGRATGLQVVQRDVPGGGDGQLVVRRRGHLEQFHALVLEQPQVLGGRHPGLRAPRGRLFQRERQVSQRLGQRVGLLLPQRRTG